MAETATTQTRVTFAAQRRSRLRQVLGRDWRIAFVFILPIIVLMLLFIAWPFLRAIGISMTARSIGRQTRFVGLENYIRLYSDRFYRQAVKNTFIFTGGAILFKSLFGLSAALLLNAQKRFRNLLTGLILLPWIIPSVVQALAWKSIFDPLFGGMNPILMFLGIIKEPLSWLADPNLAMPGVILVNVWADIPFFTVTFWPGCSPSKSSCMRPPGSMAPMPGRDSSTFPCPASATWSLSPCCCRRSGRSTTFRPSTS